MKKLIFLFLAACCASSLYPQKKSPVKSNDYKQSWDLVSSFEEQSLPKSATAEVDKILRQALADKNSPQVIKALIHQGKYNLAIDAENDTIIFHNLNEMLQKSADKTESAVLHSMLGELYLQYYQIDRWQIDQRTELGDFIPADMKEWTKNIFYDKITAQFNASLQAQSELEKASVETYSAVVELRTDSRRFYPSMYDFLALRAIDCFSQLNAGEDLSRTLAKKEISEESLFEPISRFVNLPFNPTPEDYNLWTLETYRKLLSSLQARKMNESTLLVDLQKLDYLQKLSSAYNKFALPSLQAMLEQWKGKALSVEIISKISDLQQLPKESDTPAQIEKTKQLYELLNKTIEKYPDYERINLLKSRLAQITQASLWIEGKNTFSLNGEKKVELVYKNLSKLRLKIYRVDTKSLALDYTKLPKQLVKTQEVALQQKPPYVFASDTTTLDINEYGAYIVEVETDKDIEKQYRYRSNYDFSVSDLSAFARSPEKNKYEIAVVNRISGKPIENAKIIVYQRTSTSDNPKLEVLQETVTDKNGVAQASGFEPNPSLYYQVINGKDTGSQLSHFPVPNYPYFNNSSNNREQISIFTDRGIYRPGQTVYFKAVSTILQDDKPKLVTAKKYTVELFDANHQKISEKQLTTNEFGSLAGEFVLPQNILSGKFFLKIDDESYASRVEEYKRPTFEISFDKIEKTYKFGEVISVKGKAENFSGIKLQNTVVSYTISRMQILRWGYGRGYTGSFAQGETLSDENGCFQINFTPEKDDSSSDVSPLRFPSAFVFSIEATVTDLNGETQTASYAVSVGDVSMLLNVDAGDRIEKSSAIPISFSAKNLDGADISASGTYTLSSLQDNDSVRTQISQGNFTTGEQKALQAKLKTLPSGKYRIELQSKDDYGNPVNAQKDFVLYAYDDKKPPLKTNDWYIEKNLYFSPDNPAEVILGVSDKDVHVLYEIWQETTLIERKWMTLSEENKSFKIAYKPEYKNIVFLCLSYVKDEKFFSQSSFLNLKTEQKDLVLKLDVFRDKLLPGAKEEWRLSIKDALGKPALTEVLASMYDWSLDKIYKSPLWSLTVPAAKLYFPVISLNCGSFFGDNETWYVSKIQDYPTQGFSYDHFNWYEFSLSNRILTRGALIRGLSKSTSVANAASNSVDVAELESDKVIVDESEVFHSFGGILPARSQKSNFVSAEDITETSAPQIRRNFNETAFFYPQLRTNENGELQIAFTVPESNTQWKFRVLAHDKNLNSVQNEAVAVSRKELMVTPNIPRFLRHGDVATVSAKISNLSDTTAIGTVRFVLFNPLTDETIPSGALQPQPFSLKAGASGNASWTFNVPDGLDLLGLRVIAESALFSDGEQHAIAILPKRMMLTESLPMDLNGKQTKQFTFDRLTENEKSTSAENYRLTLEFASNPAWYAIQALPVLSNPDNENAVNWFASYYANTLGLVIGQTHPKVSAMIDAWKKQGGDEESLLSNLEKNEELKNVLLEETPWVLEAKNESEQKQKLSLIFDLNRNQNLTSAAIAKLKELQTENGGWSWFKGFYPSRSITQYILYGFNRLNELKAAQPDNNILSMQKKAVAYIDSEALRGFEQLKKYNGDWENIKTISTGDLEYLYVRSAYTYPMSKETSEMFDFYTSVMMTNWTQYGLYERSLIAALAQRKGQTAVAQSILQSYREHATVSDEMGMFWGNNRSHVFMSQSAVSVHTFIMDAFLKNGASTTEMNDMKRWLLKQKQTQLWESTHASIDAVYALLSTGSDWLSTEGNTKITLGKQIVEPEKATSGTGYFKETWQKPEIEASMARVEVQNNADVPAWGALYLQYFEDLSRINKTDASLDIEKMLFVEQADKSGKKLVQITENSPLKTGDKVIVRLTVRSDRDLDFVHLKDMRAACFEPVEQISGIKWRNAAPYYQSSKDAATHFYFDVLPRGTYVFEYAVYVTRTGCYSNGITSLQCLYAPQFTSHTAGSIINVKQ
ncbi:MAG: hypothetical protein LBR48_08710 [Dysgonamonadaceae bacterium]|jgi:uncharacterized protein YfaS (alpha-2-macroglobulin family)|nr:hypothetical protein [Dysgonamonadaceae bacterium]